MEPYYILDKDNNPIPTDIAGYEEWANNNNEHASKQQLEAEITTEFTQHAVADLITGKKYIFHINLELAPDSNGVTIPRMTFAGANTWKEAQSFHAEAVEHYKAEGIRIEGLR